MKASYSMNDDIITVIENLSRDTFFRYWAYRPLFIPIKNRVQFYSISSGFSEGTAGLLVKEARANGFCVVTKREFQDAV